MLLVLPVRPLSKLGVSSSSGQKGGVTNVASVSCVVRAKMVENTSEDTSETSDTSATVSVVGSALVCFLAVLWLERGSAMAARAAIPTTIPATIGTPVSVNRRAETNASPLPWGPVSPHLTLMATSTFLSVLLPLALSSVLVLGGEGGRGRGGR